MLRLPRPSHQQIPFYRILLQLLRILLPQSLNTLKAKQSPSSACLEAKEYSCCQSILAITLLILSFPPRQHHRKAKKAVISFIQLLSLIKLLQELVQS